MVLSDPGSFVLPCCVYHIVVSVMEGGSNVLHGSMLFQQQVFPVPLRLPSATWIQWHAQCQLLWPWHGRINEPHAWPRRGSCLCRHAPWTDATRADGCPTPLWPWYGSRHGPQHGPQHGQPPPGGLRNVPTSSPQPEATGCGGGGGSSSRGGHAAWRCQLTNTQQVPYTFIISTKSIRNRYRETLEKPQSSVT